MPLAGFYRACQNDDAYCVRALDEMLPEEHEFLLESGCAFGGQVACNELSDRALTSASGMLLFRYELPDGDQRSFICGPYDLWSWWQSNPSWESYLED